MDWDATVAKWKVKTGRMAGDPPFRPGGRPVKPSDPVPDDPAEAPVAPVQVPNPIPGGA